MSGKTKTDQDDLSISEAAASTGRCIESIYRLVRSRRIEAAKDKNGNWRIPRKELTAYYGDARNT